MTVYITQEPKQLKTGWVPDLSDASKYGPIKYIFKSHDSVFQNISASIELAKKILVDFDHEKDFILTTPMCDPASSWITIMVIMSLHAPSITFLMWDRIRDENNKRNSGYYIPKEINIDHSDYFNN